MQSWLRDELRSFFDDPRGRSQTAGTRAASGVFPPVNIYDDGESFLVRTELPGVAPEGLDISAKGDQLVIRGERTVDAPGEQANLHRREREGGTFRRAVTLPQEIDPDNVHARLQHGVLDVYAPRSPKARPRRIEVES
jgi:HSP20 family protein